MQQLDNSTVPVLYQSEEFSLFILNGEKWHKKQSVTLKSKIAFFHAIYLPKIPRAIHTLSTLSRMQISFSFRTKKANYAKTTVNRDKLV